MKGLTNYGNFQADAANEDLENDPGNSENLRVGMKLKFNHDQSELRLQHNIGQSVSPDDEFEICYSTGKESIYLRHTKSNKAIYTPQNSLKLFTAAELCQLIKNGEVTKLSQ